MYNFSYHYYKGYYENFPYWDKLNISNDDKLSKIILNFFEKKNKLFTGSEIDPETPRAIEPNTIELYTAYPGLISGTGYTHGIKADGEFKIGFAFDHVSGMPSLQGSSVKGKLRAAFPEFNSDISFKNNEIDPVKTEWVLRAIHEIKGLNEPFVYSIDSTVEHQQLAKFIDECFSGKKATSTKEESKFLSIYNRDIFYEAVLINKADKAKKFLGIDSITPHNQSNPLKNPIPLPFLKVLPNISFQFKFDLKDSFYLTKEQKLELFKKILLTFGIGAKTNVGYGQFQESPSHILGTIDDLKEVHSNTVGTKQGVPSSHLRHGEYYAEYLRTDEKDKTKHIMLVNHKNNTQIEVEYIYRLLDVLTDTSHQIIVGIDARQSKFRISSFRRIKK